VVGQAQRCCASQTSLNAGEHPCDKRRSVAEYRQEFPGVDFSEVQMQAVWQQCVAGTMQAKQRHELACSWAANSWDMTCMQIETDADVMCKPDVRETDAEIAERGYRFLQVSDSTQQCAL
jgi:hypothetical protein